MNNCAYTNLEIAKDGNQICIFSDGKAMYSKYAPLKDAGNFANNNNLKASSFIVIAGIGNGYHIQETRKVNKDAIIIAFEYDIDSLNFVLEKTQAKELLNDKNIHFCTIKELQSTILNYFISFMNNSFTFFYQIVWKNYYKDKVNEIENTISIILKSISSDLSVQAHFGLIWNKNIFSNLSQYQQNKQYIDRKKVFPIQKKAAIIGAGPSLDFSINELIKNKDNYYIIATDTALTALLKHNLIPDAFISIDGQQISCEHFFNLQTLNNKSLAIIDLCANSVVLKESLKANLPIQLIHNNHPLAVLASEYYQTIPNISSGAGTVAMSAIDFSVFIGFTDIEIFGCDFMYSYGKPYTKGTYLENQYFCNSTKLKTIEQQYSSLMFRTLLQKGKTEHQFTTDVLLSYARDLEIYSEKKMKEHGNIQIKIFNNYSMANIETNKTKNTSLLPKKETIFEYIIEPTQNRDFFGFYSTLIDNLKESEYHTSLYPLLCWYNNKYRKDSANLLFFVKNLVKKLIANYN